MIGTALCVGQKSSNLKRSPKKNRKGIVVPPAFLKEENALKILLGVLDSIHDAIVTIDSSHKVLFYNKRAEEIFGYTREEVIGNDLSTIMSHNCARDHRSAVKRYLETGVSKLMNQHSEIIAVRKGNIPFPASITFYITKVEDETYFTAVIKDLSEAKDMEERLSACEAMAGLGRMLAEVTHELRNPLMSIGGFARQLRKYVTDEVGEKKLQIILKEVERLEGLIRDLKEYHLAKEPPKADVDLVPLLREVVELFSPALKEIRATIDLRLLDEALVVFGNKDRLKQVFINVIQNALDAVDEGGLVQVIAQKEGEKAIVEVIDNGIGLTEEEVAKVFEPFYTTKPKGTGLGLCISKKIIEEHHGDSIEVRSEKGKGTTVRIGLPLKDSSSLGKDGNSH